jgi:hypothetical protein
VQVKVTLAFFVTPIADSFQYCLMFPVSLINLRNTEL